MDITRKTLPAQHYIYVDREAAYAEPGAIADAMASGFGAVFAFKEQNAIAPLSMPTSIYVAMPEGEIMAFRAGFFVSEADAGKAAGDVQAGVIAAGDVVAATHVGPYAALSQSHQALWKYVEDNALTAAMPVWEIYVDDPTTTPEDTLRTEIYRAVGA